MVLLEHVLGSRFDALFSDRLHDLEHQGGVDIVTLLPADLARRRFRTTSAKGVDVAIALARNQKLFDGAILLFEQNRAIVVRVHGEQWLRLQPSCSADALELGYHAGNLHWRVRFQGAALLIALEAPIDDYLDRLGSLITDRRVLPSIVKDV